MGIPGLTTYITNRSELYLEPFDLHDTYLVIDGSSIMYQLYNWYTKSNCAFGGDYDKYAHVVRKFFEGLQKCNVTPLVILDGGGVDKKDHTVLKRAQEKIQAAKSYTPLSQNALKFFPSLGSEVFRSILREMGIRHVQCLFEADNAIAAVAKYINCPVLSYDSDFYIYGVSYIPFNTLDTNITKKLKENVKRCKIYRITSLLNTFPGLDASMLPLAATLLGNDYIEQSTFKHFYRLIKFPKVGRLNHNTQQCRIEAILYWLSKRKLDTAICMIIDKIPHDNKKKILKTIKMIMDEYTTTSTNMLIPLGFSEEDIVKITSQSIQNNSNIEADTNHLKIIKEIAIIHEITDIDDSECKTELEAFINSLPTWYINEYQKALLPNYFMNLLMGGGFVSFIQIEDYHQPSSVFISLEIMNVIFTLLTRGFEQNSGCGEYLTRGENNQLKRYSLKYVDSICSCNIPYLNNLRNISFTVRREIFDVTLGIGQQLDEFPINWRLYIATAKYWIDRLKNVRSDSHIYALLFAMLRHVVDEKIGYYRSMHKFQTRYTQKLQMLESTKKVKSNDLPCSTQMSIMQALNAVEVDDCILLAPFFIKNSEMSQEIHTNKKKFRIQVVHLFALFQSCIEHSFHLNALLGFPYDVTSISKMYNGTLLYNLYNNFNKRSNIENYINCILQCSPTLLQLFNIILIKAKLMFKISATKKKGVIQE